MRSLFLKLGIACGFLLGIAGIAPAQTPKIQVLIITGQNGHDWRATTPVLRKILEDTKRFEVRVTEEFRGAGPETLAPYDLVVLNYYDGNKPALRWGTRADDALLEFVRGGKGLVVYHFSAAAFNGWSEFEQMCAGNWRPNNGHHSARHDFTITVADPEHPITRGMRATFPQANDELYANLKWQPEGSYHVLATAYDDHALYKSGRETTDSRSRTESADAVGHEGWQRPRLYHRAGARSRCHEVARLHRYFCARRRVGRHRRGHLAAAG